VRDDIREEIKHMFDDDLRRFPDPPGRRARMLQHAVSGGTASRRHGREWALALVAAGIAVAVVATLLVNARTARPPQLPAGAPPPTQQAVPSPTASTPSPTAASTPTPTPTSANRPLTPFVNCVVITPATQRSTATYTAYLGYDNQNSGTVRIPFGPNNGFPGALGNGDMGQPEDFLPGRHDRVFWFATDTDQTSVWNLRGPDGVLRSVTVSVSDPRC
jgi:hypothetical protein